MTAHAHSTTAVRKAAISIVVSATVLALAIVGMQVLAAMRQPPAESNLREQSLRVEAIRVTPVDMPVTIQGFGTVRALNAVQIAAEVPGRIVSVHPRLEVGEIIPEGDELFAIDPIDYEARLREAEAMTAQARTNVAMLRSQESVDRERLETVLRSRDIAQGEFERMNRLYQADSAVSRTMSERAEQAFNQARDAYDQLKQLVDLYPLRIQEAESALERALAATRQAQASLERTRVVAPFSSRVQAVNVEQGQYAAPGVPLLSVADDSLLEISVPLESTDARRWLLFDEHDGSGTASWFGKPAQVFCEIRWSEDTGDQCWQGVLDRIERIDELTRTVTVAVRITGEQARAPDGGSLPLVEGMFCSVAIPGKTLEGVFKLPPWAVSFENTVYEVVDGRLQTTPVTVARLEKTAAYISEGLEPGDAVIVTRLTNPLENTLVDVAYAGSDPSESDVGTTREVEAEL